VAFDSVNTVPENTFQKFGGSDTNSGISNINAVSAAESYFGAKGGKLVFPRGIYCGNMAFPSNLTLELENGAIFHDSVVIKGTIQADLTQHFMTNVNLDSASIKEFYPEWWGAAGDNITNDSVALQNTLSSLSGGTLYLTNKYYAGGLTIKNSNSIIKGNYLTSSLTTSSCCDLLSFYNTADTTNIISNVTIEGINFYRNTSVTWHNAFIAVQNRAGIKNITIDSCTFTNTSTENSCVAITVYDCLYNPNSPPENINIENCTFNMGDKAIKAINPNCGGIALHVFGAKSFCFGNNTINNCGGYDVASVNIDGGNQGPSQYGEIKNNIFIDNNNSIHGIIESEGIDTCLVQNNTFMAGSLNIYPKIAINFNGLLMIADNNKIYGATFCGIGFSSLNTLSGTKKILCTNNKLFNTPSISGGTFSAGISVWASTNNKFTIESAVIKNNVVNSPVEAIKVYSNSRDSTLIRKLVIANNYFEAPLNELYGAGGLVTFIDTLIDVDNIKTSWAVSGIPVVIHPSAGDANYNKYILNDVDDADKYSK